MNRSYWTYLCQKANCQWLELEKFKRITPAMIKAIAVIRIKETGSLKMTIPKIAVPAAPIPVQTA